MEQLSNMPIWAQILSMSSFMFASGVLMTRIPLAPVLILSFFYLYGAFGTSAEMPNFTLKSPSFWLCIQIALFLIVCTIVATTNDKGPVVDMGWAGLVVMGVLGIAFCIGGGLSIIVNLYKYLQLSIFCFSKVNFAVLGVLCFVAGAVFGGLTIARPYISTVLPPMGLWLGFSYIAMALFSVLVCGIVLWGISKGMPILSLIAIFFCAAILLCEYPLYQYVHLRGPQAREIITAVEKGDTAQVKQLLEQRSLVKMRDEKGNTPLMIASSSGYLDIVQELLAHKADVNAVNRWGETALFVACQQGHIEIVKALLEAGADVNKGEPALVGALKEGYTEIARILLDSNVDVNKANDTTALIVAAGKNEKEIVKLLLDRGADVNAQDRDKDTALIASSRGWENQAEIVAMLLSKGADATKTNLNGMTALQFALGKKEKEEEARLLYQAGGRLGRISSAENTKVKMEYACSNGFTEVVKQLLQAGVKPTAHHAIMAAQEGQTEVLKQLVAAGLDINQPDEEGNHSFLYAVGHGHLETVQFFVEHGADLTVEDVVKNGGTAGPALVLASLSGHLPIVKYLVEQRVDVNSTNRHKDTPLQMAAKTGLGDVVRFLLTAGANVNQQNKHGDTALSMGCEKNHVDVVQELLKNGANVNLADVDNDTALGNAAFMGSVEAARLLIAAHANVNTKNNEGKTPLAIAKEKGHGEMVRLLKSAGAKE